jgi:hypothetical protein
MFGFFSTDGTGANMETDFSSSSDSLSPGAIAGIVIGIVIVLGGGFVAGLCLYRRFCGDNPRVQPHHDRNRSIETRIGFIEPSPTVPLAADTRARMTAVIRPDGTVISRQLTRDGTSKKLLKTTSMEAQDKTTDVGVIRNPKGEIVSRHVIYTQPLTQAELKAAEAEAEKAATEEEQDGMEIIFAP